MKTKLMQLADDLVRANQAIYKDETHKEAEGINLARATLEAEVDRVVAERDALKADAERYRWLREQDENQFRALAYETPDWIDAYIDAMKGES